MNDHRNLSDWREILAGAEDDESGSRECLEDYERTLLKVRERHEQDLRSLERIRAHVALLEELASAPLEEK